MDDNDLLYSNTYNPAKESQGYGLTEELKRFKLRDHIEKQQMTEEVKSKSKQPIPVDDKMFVNDLLNTNRVINEKGEPNPINERTTFKEVRSVYSINSNQRAQYATRPFENPSAYESIFSQSGYELFNSIYEFYQTYLGLIGLTSDDADYLIYKTNLKPLYNLIVNTNAPIFYNLISIVPERNALPFNTFIVSNNVGIITFDEEPVRPFEIESLIYLRNMPLNNGLVINNRPFTVLNCSTTFVEFDFNIADDYPDYEYIGGTRPDIKKYYTEESLTDYSTNERFLIENQFTILNTFKENFVFITTDDDTDTVAKVEDLLIITQWFNVLASTTDIGLTRNFWQPFYVYEDVIQEYTYDQTESNYSITLPDYIQNCKSIRLLSTEIPNTIPNIMPKNNVLFLSIARDVIVDNKPKKVVYLPENLKQKKYNFQLIQLDVGQYTVISVLQHMETKLNENLRGIWFNPNDESDVIEINPEETFFEITFNESTGKINITLNSIDYNFSFHLKFYSNQLNTGAKPSIAVPGYDDPGLDELWFKLGFPWPALVSNSGMDIYQRELTNCIDNSHGLLTDSYSADDIICNTNFNTGGIFTATDIVGRDLIKEYNDNRYQRPFRYPIMTRINYIYLAIRGFKNIKNNIFDKNNEIYDLFAKVLLNVPAGTMAFNTFVDNPWVFTDVHDTKISKLDFQWVDPEGNLVDFGRVNHSFTLEFITYVSNADVNAYNTKLGVIDKSSYPEYLTGKSGGIK
jgi:hypothetical protein